MSLPVIRSHERMDFKRCQRKWFWHWRKGLVPKNKSFGALDLGTWVHDAFAVWYLPATAKREVRRWGVLSEHFHTIARAAIERSKETVPDFVLAEADELYALGLAMMEAYEKHYGRDERVSVVKPEIPLEFDFSDEEGTVFAKHKLKPDMLYRDTETGKLWLMEHKTAKTVKVDHLAIDDQARPYGAMSERALRRAGLFKKGDRLAGINYNFIRKGMPDERETDAEGRALNKDGTVSKRQPAPFFARYPVFMSTGAKAQTLLRLRAEVALITTVTDYLRRGELRPSMLTKTPHKSCPRFCDYFEMCKLEEEGADISVMQRSAYRIENPYAYGESTDEHTGFEVG